MSIAVTLSGHLACHIPNRGGQMVRYYGYYSNKCRGQHKKAGSDEIVPSITGSSASFASRKSWAQLIQKIYEVDPLTAVPVLD